MRSVFQETRAVCNTHNRMYAIGHLQIQFHLIMGFLDCGINSQKNPEQVWREHTNSAHEPCTRSRSHNPPPLTHPMIHLASFSSNTMRLLLLWQQQMKKGYRPNKHRTALGISSSLCDTRQSGFGTARAPGLHLNAHIFPERRIAGGVFELVHQNASSGWLEDEEGQ